jgi:hypothetical protein
MDSTSGRFRPLVKIPKGSGRASLERKGFTGVVTPMRKARFPGKSRDALGTHRISKNSRKVKFAAALRAAVTWVAKAGSALIRIGTHAGHGSGKKSIS